MTFNRIRRVACALAGFAIAAAAHAQDIKLGYNGDLSASPSAQSGQAAVLGMQAAIDDINAAGGVLGRKLELVVRDDTSQPPKSIQNMSDLIDNEQVVAVFGPTNSGNAMAWKHIPNQKKIPVIGNVGSGTDITKPMSAGADNYMFRVSMVDREQVSALMAYVRKNTATSKVVGDDTKGAVTIRITMNGVTRAVPFAYTTTPEGTVEAKGSIDLLNFNLKSAFDSLHEACKDKHVGPDGVAKTWTQVDLLLTGKFKKECS